MDGNTRYLRSIQRIVKTLCDECCFYSGDDGEILELDNDPDILLTELTDMMAGYILIHEDFIHCFGQEYRGKYTATFVTEYAFMKAIQDLRGAIPHVSYFDKSQLKAIIGV